ncbi:thioesterase II family protein [Streptomyces sp. URMC 126]|uniref:thioesterase II family protein n=1 Tax=Streptomyces sp. URMC 126 TaxID=3423401 RepID=UPI003F1D17B9
MSQPSPGDELWCRRFHPARNPAARLVCLPHAGGSASYFLPVAAALRSGVPGAPDVDVLAIQYPGRQDRRAEQPIDDLAILADRLHGVIRRQPELPLTILGHSLGATLAFEVARRLEADGHSPVRLFASGRRAPSTVRDETAHRSDATIMAEVRRLSGTASALLGDEEMMRAALPALRADYKAAETYRCEPGVTVRCPITVLTGDSDPKTTLDEAKAWERHTTGSFDLRVFTGGHFFIGDRSAEVMEVLKEHFRSEGAYSAG